VNLLNGKIILKKSPLMITQKYLVYMLMLILHLD